MEENNSLCGECNLIENAGEVQIITKNETIIKKVCNDCFDYLDIKNKEAWGDEYDSNTS